jgi:hypothetical protein
MFPPGPDTDKAAKKLAAAAKTDRLQSHDVPDSYEWWLAHAEGRDQRNNPYYRGVYSHQHAADGSTSGRDVNWDLDEDFPGKTPAQLAYEHTSKLLELFPLAAVYSNASFGGTGVHTHLLFDFQCPSWLRMEFGKAITRSCGYAVGGNPSKAEIEVFPKQDGVGKRYGNLLGLPACERLMKQGRTNVLRRDWTKIPTLEETAALLETLRPIDRDTFYAACRKLGIDPEKKPEAKKVGAAPRLRTFVSGGKAVNVSIGMTKLADEVRGRITLTEYLAQIGCEPRRGGTHYLCPVQLVSHSY